MTHILLVDDDAQLLRALRIDLTARGYDVTAAADGRTALIAAARDHPDLVVLDLGLPDLDGTTVLGELRTFSTAPVVVLSARTDSADKVHALDLGADDYVTKPFGVDELMARMRAALRRATSSAEPDPERVAFGDVVVDLATTTVERGGRRVHLTPTEWAILDLLVRHRGRLVTRRRLLEHVWGTGDRKETSYLRVYLAQLRRKLETDAARPQHLLTEAGMGYRFEP